MPIVLVTKYTIQNRAQVPCSWSGKYRMQLKGSVMSAAAPTSSSSLCARYTPAPYQPALRSLHDHPGADSVKNTSAPGPTLLKPRSALVL